MRLRIGPLPRRREAGTTLYLARTLWEGCAHVRARTVLCRRRAAFFCLPAVIPFTGDDLEP